MSIGSKKVTIDVEKNKKDYSDREPVKKDSFSKFFNSKLKLLNEKTGYSISKRDIGNMLGISYEVFRKYINKEKKCPKRDCIIAICAMLQLDSDDTSEGLYYYNMMELSEYNKRDYLIMNILDEPELKSQEIIIGKINKELIDNEFNDLEIINQRKDKIEYPYRLVKKELESYYDSTEENPYNSLETQYSINLGIHATMLLDNNKNGYLLSADAYGHYSRTDYPKVGEYYHEYNSIDETREFKNCFIELQQSVNIQKRKIAERLNDTRNYGERISAKVINNELHLFYETYNYALPASGEYYIMDYTNAKNTMYVSNRSHFMKFYLSDDEYKELIGMPRKSIDALNDIKEKYCSSDSNSFSIDPATNYNDNLIKYRIRAFKKAKQNIDSLINDLKSRKRHIRNIKWIYDNLYDVLKYYKVTDNYQCRYDSEFDEINGLGLEKVSFALSNGESIELSFEDICDGFSLGLNTIEEIGMFLLKHNTLDIAEILVGGTLLGP